MCSQSASETASGLFPRGFKRDTAFQWPLRRVDTLVELKYGKSLVESKRSPGSIPVYGTNGQCGWHDERLVEGPGVILGRKGMGHLGVEWSDGDYWVIDTAYFVDPIERDLDLKWFYYLIKHIGLDHLKEGTSNPSLQRETFGAQLVPYPSAIEQKRIAHILGTLDDKIELNRKMNQTLEAIARAIFKSWFVDFDPVIDNALAAGKPIPEEFAERAARRAQLTHGKSPLPENIRRLFPDEFQDSELGPIPKGWEVGPLGRFFEVGLGGAWGKDAGTSKDVVVRCLRGIDCHELAEGRLPEAPVRWLTPKQVDARRLADGVILVEGSGSFCGRSFLWRTEYERLFGEPVVYSNFCKRLNPTCTLWQATVCWQFMRKAYREGEIQSFRTGTAFPNLDIHNLLGNLIVCVPPEPVARTYGQFFELTSRPDLIERSRTLAALRDTLLPKLMSGELRVKDAEWLTLTTSTLKKKV